jgi:hypothetical protein
MIKLCLLKNVISILLSAGWRGTLVSKLLVNKHYQNYFGPKRSEMAFLRTPHMLPSWSEHQKSSSPKGSYINTLRLIMMKKLTIYLLGICFMVLMSSSCKTVVHVNSSGNIPPGQMKKMTSSQSAKPYAPGQHKVKNDHKH